MFPPLIDTPYYTILSSITKRQTLECTQIGLKHKGDIESDKRMGAASYKHRKNYVYSKNYLGPGFLIFYCTNKE